MTSSDERKCLKCEFSAPVSDWKVYPEYHPHNILCYECRYMHCKVCEYSGRVSTWRYEENGVSGKRCPSCADGTYRKCTNCDFAVPLRDRKIKKVVFLGSGAKDVVNGLNKRRRRNPMR